MYELGEEKPVTSTLNGNECGYPSQAVDDCEDFDEA